MSLTSDRSVDFSEYSGFLHQYNWPPLYSRNIIESDVKNHKPNWFCLFKYLWVLTFPLEDCSEFGNFVITLINPNVCVYPVENWGEIRWISLLSQLFKSHTHKLYILGHSTNIVYIFCLEFAIKIASPLQ